MQCVQVVVALTEVLICSVECVVLALTKFRAVFVLSLVASVTLLVLCFL